jgi:hypothetical protein
MYNEHMDKIYLDPEIFYIKDILSEESLNLLKLFCEEETGWEPHHHRYLKMMDCDIQIIYKDIFDKILSVADPENKFTAIMGDVVTMFKAGESMKIEDFGEEWSMTPHSDRSNAYFGQSTIEKGFIFYINDDYEGGEISYINKGIEFKPLANSVLIHSAYPEFTHGVKRVDGKNRYVITGFIDNKA